jgi:hypothetical protein
MRAPAHAAPALIPARTPEPVVAPAAVKPEPKVEPRTAPKAQPQPVAKPAQAPPTPPIRAVVPKPVVVPKPPVAVEESESTVTLPGADENFSGDELSSPPPPAEPAPQPATGSSYQQPSGQRSPGLLQPR